MEKLGRSRLPKVKKTVWSHKKARNLSFWNKNIFIYGNFSPSILANGETSWMGMFLHGKRSIM
jgi:hypothetical protein